MKMPLKAFPPWRDQTELPSMIADEITPFIFKGKRYRLENIMYHSIAGEPLGYNFMEDHFRIREEESMRPISHPLVGYYFATAFVKDDVCYVFAADLGPRTKPVWRCKRIVVISSTDLVSWSAPQTVIEAEGDENLFNNSVTTDGKRFYMVYESNDKRYPVFTAKFAVSDDLIHWEKIPGGIYGKDKYIGGPALYHAGEYFYFTYVNCVNEEAPNDHKEYYDTRVTRTKDFISWEDAPADRPVLSPDFTKVIDMRHPGVYERNASDAEFIEQDAVVTVYWCGGNQLGLANTYRAEYDGTLQQLFESFFQ